MPPTAPQVFSNISPAQYAALIQRANQSGIALTGNSGTTSQFDVDLAWEYAPATGQLSIQCLSAPFFMSMESVNAKIRSLVQGAISQESVHDGAVRSQ